ncbi:MAG: desulfoferrodoxin family protein [Oscillospiraceae bacterium]|jgi:superoxide reductase
MSESRFFICRHCGNLVGMIFNSGVSMECCGEAMEQLVAGSVDASEEKHVPVVKVEGNKVTVAVGSAEHPMLPEHYIQWIYLQTENGGQRKELKPGDKPEAVFMLAEGESPVAAFEYCNIHGLWKAEV